ncbi:MAG: protein kinase [Nitrospirota bacterium]|nr:protein kinase [Nitrospirota bacterium]
MNFPPPTAEDIKVLFPQFQEVRFLKTGGFKAVYKAVVKDRPEAFKLVYVPEVNGVDPEVAKEIRKESLGRITREIKILNNCKSPEIVKLGSMQPSPVSIGGREYIAYSEEYLDGNALRELINQSTKPTEDDIRALFLSLLKAIRELWSFNVIHRDIKPDNVMKLNQKDRRFVVLDLGIAFSPADTPLTFDASHRLPPGTFRYIAPEMLQPGFRDSIDFRSDIYTAAMTVYEYAAWQHPLAKDKDDLIATLSRIVRESPKSLKEHRPDLSQLVIGTVDQMLKKIPALRPSNINMLIDKLERNI